MNVWFKVDDSIYDHPKFLGLPDSAVALWLRAGAYSARHLTDGFVSRTALQALVPNPHRRRTLIEALVRHRLWELEGDAYVFHDWADWQPSRTDINTARQRNAERQQRWRNRQRNASRNGQDNGVTGGVSNPPTNAAPSRPESVVPLGATGSDRYAGARDPSGARPLHGLPADDQDGRQRFARGPGAASKPPPRQRRPEDRSAAEATAQATGRQPHAPLSEAQARAHADDIRKALASLRTAGLTSADAEGDPDDPEFT